MVTDEQTNWRIDERTDGRTDDYTIRYDSLYLTCNIHVNLTSSQLCLGYHTDELTGRKDNASVCRSGLAEV